MRTDGDGLAAVPAIPKILLVDDVQLFLEIEKGFLESSPVQILTARNGEEALEVIRRELPSLVVMDINMPRLDGITCCSIIKADPALAAIPVIMVTNAGRADDVRQSWRAGCDDFLEKPVNGRVFLEKTHRFLQVIERRKRRVAFDREVMLQMAGQEIGALAVDLSYNGVYVATVLDLPVDAELLLSFSLLDAASPRIIARSRVAWLNVGGGRRKQNYPPGVGIEFREIIGEGLAMVRMNELRDFVDLHRETG
ncbi:MAG: response regulator [Geobacter sp.]|nr:response regulator [Geobacter sp.]